MESKYKVYYVKEFPIEKITDLGTSGWHNMPNHTRSRYRFDDAVLEHIDNTFCEPIQILMHDERQVVAGPSGVVRLHALIHKRGATTIPAIVSTKVEPDWLDTSEPVVSLEQFRGYYRLEPMSIGFDEDGKAYHHNFNPNPEQLMETFMVSDETKERMLAMLKEEESI